MSCCGRTTRFPLSAPNPAAPLHGNRSRRDLPQGATSFEYVGKTAFTVVGPATGRAYRFDRTGARLVVDPRDVARLRAVPKLRRV